MPRVYHVLIRGGVSDRALDVMRKGMTLAEGEKLAPVEIRVLPGQVHDLSGVSRNAEAPAGQRGTLLEMTLHQGLNRQIRRMCEAVGLDVIRLRRSALGAVKLGMLQPGQYRELTSQEVTALRTAASRGKATAAIAKNTAANAARRTAAGPHGPRAPKGAVAARKKRGGNRG